MTAVINVWWVTYDHKNNPARREIEIPSSTAPAAALQFLNDFLPIVNQITNGAILEAGVNFRMSPVDELGFSENPALTADNEEMGQFVFKAGQFITDLTIPSFDESKILPMSREIDVADPDVWAFVTAMIDGINGIEPEKRGDDILYMTAAVEAWGGKRKKKKRRWL